MSVATGARACAAVNPAASLHCNVIFNAPTSVTHVGGVTSLVHVTILMMVAVLPHISVTINVLVCDSVHPTVETVPSFCVIVGTPHASVAVAEPNAAFIADTLGLQPSVVLLYIPVNTGAVTSLTHVTVLEVVDVLLQASVAVKVLVCDLVQPTVVIDPSNEVIVGVPHPSLAVAKPSAAPIAAPVGLHPMLVVV